MDFEIEDSGSFEGYSPRSSYGSSRPNSGPRFIDTQEDEDVYDYDFNQNEKQNYRIAPFSPASKVPANNQPKTNPQPNALRFSNESALERAKSMLDRYSQKSIPEPISNFKKSKASRSFDDADDISISMEDDEEDESDDFHESNISESQESPIKKIPSHIKNTISSQPKQLPNSIPKARIEPSRINKYDESVEEIEEIEDDEDIVEEIDDTHEDTHGKDDEEEEEAEEEQYSDEEFEAAEDNIVPTTSKPPINNVNAKTDYLRNIPQFDDNGSYSRLRYDNDYESDEIEEEVEEDLESSKPKIFSFSDFVNQPAWDKDPIVNTKSDIKPLEVKKISSDPTPSTKPPLHSSKTGLFDERKSLERISTDSLVKNDVDSFSSKSKTNLIESSVVSKETNLSKNNNFGFKDQIQIQSQISVKNDVFSDNSQRILTPNQSIPIQNISNLEPSANIPQNNQIPPQFQSQTQTKPQFQSSQQSFYPTNEQSNPIYPQFITTPSSSTNFQQYPFPYNQQPNYPLPPQFSYPPMGYPNFPPYPPYYPPYYMNSFPTHTLDPQSQILTGLVDELKKSQEEALWARNALADLMMKFQETQTCSFPNIQPKNNKAKKILESEDGSSDDYSDDFEVSNLNIQNSFLKKKVENVPNSVPQPQINLEAKFNQPGPASSALNSMISDVQQPKPPAFSHSPDPLLDSIAYSLLASQELLRSKLETLKMKVKFTMNPEQIINNSMKTNLSSIDKNLENMTENVQINKKTNITKILEIVKQKYPLMNEDDLKEMTQRLEGLQT